MEQERDDIYQIIEGCKNDDRKAQERLYRSYYGVMMNLCLRYTGGSTDALSVLNLGFLKVFRNIQRYDPGKASLYTWIRTIIINSCLDHNRSRESKKETHVLDDATEVAIEPGIVARMQAGEILELVRQLPPATKSVFNLYVMEGYTHKEIAGLLQISEGTSKWHLSEARRNLKRMLEEQDEQL